MELIMVTLERLAVLLLFDIPARAERVGSACRRLFLAASAFRSSAGVVRHEEEIGGFHETVQPAKAGLGEKRSYRRAA
ncbi:MAG: hypothetical protein ABIF82_07945 [Planctomycetota bacterium]